MIKKFLKSFYNKKKYINIKIYYIKEFIYNIQKFIKEKIFSILEILEKFIFFIKNIYNFSKNINNIKDKVNNICKTYNYQSIIHFKELNTKDTNYILEYIINIISIIIPEENDYKLNISISWPSSNNNNNEYILYNNFLNRDKKINSTINDKLSALIEIYKDEGINYDSYNILTIKIIWIIDSKSKWNKKKYIFENIFNPNTKINTLNKIIIFKNYFITKILKYLYNKFIP